MPQRSLGTPRVSFQEVRKTFDGVIALDGVTFDVGAGSIHALLGANGAGKSTLIKVLSGFYRPDSGQIAIDGEAASADAPISFIHQDLALVDDLSVAENIALLRGYPLRWGRIAWRRVREQAVSALDVVGGGIDVDVKAGSLTRADQSLVAIARGISMECRVLVLDEPTASLPDADVARLFEILFALRDRGVSILYVSHRLDEIRQIADRVTVLRDGRVIADAAIHGISDAQIVDAIVGSAVVHPVRRPGRAGQPLLEIRDGRIDDTAERFDFDVARGEVLGVAGLRGAGHEHVGRAVAGIAPLAEGRILLHGRPVELRHVRAAIRSRIGFATSRREQEALAMTLTARENFYLNPGAVARTGRPYLTGRWERARAAGLARDVRLRPADPEAIVATFSGGNQQKVVLGRWLSVQLDLLVLEEPTMGIDVGARAEIYALLHRLADAGLALLVVSSDFEEMATVCDRALVFDRGAIRADLRGDDLTVDALTRYASGTTQEGSPS